MNENDVHDGTHVECLYCDITRLARPRWWSSYRFDWRDIVIVVQFALILVMLLWT